MSGTHPVLGLTGGVGSGKSAVSHMLGEWGADVIDTDVIAHALCAPGGAAIPAIRTAFGARFITAAGALDRAAMRSAAFADQAMKQKLEAILHPLIRAEAARQLDLAKAAYAVLVVPLLVETGSYWVSQCDRIAVVDCPEDLQVERVVARSALSAEQVRAIIAAQATREQRRAVAHEIIDNTGDFDSLRAQVAALHARMLKIGRDG